MNKKERKGYFVFWSILVFGTFAGALLCIGFRAAGICLIASLAGYMVGLGVGRWGKEDE